MMNICKLMNPRVGLTSMLTLQKGMTEGFVVNFKVTHKSADNMQQILFAEFSNAWLESLLL